METDIVPPAGAHFGDIQFYPFTIETLIGLFVLVILLIISALISGSEVAFFSLGPKDKHQMEENKGRSNALVLRLLTIPEQLLATILVGNNFVNIGIVILSAHITNMLIDFSAVPTLGFIFQAVVITFLLLLFGEIIPKVYATQYPRSFAIRMAPMLNGLEKITRPLNHILISSTAFVNKRATKHRKYLSIDEISKALELTDEMEFTEDKEILEGIVKFGNKSVTDIMRSRVDLVTLNIRDDYTEVLRLINESGYSRIPVYSETFDNIRGILYIKDLLAHLPKGNTFRWQSLLRPPFYVPESKKIDELLEEFQKNKVHMAIVVDEYGGTSGLVTLEDVLEEIVGDIADEFDEEEEYYTRIGENEYLFDGKTMLNDFYKVFDVPDTIFDEKKGDADTLAGLILELQGEIPAKNEKIECDDFLFQIEESDARRIKRIRVFVTRDNEKGENI